MTLNSCTSTRDLGVNVSLRDAITTSKPTQGGLFVPAHWPEVSQNEMHDMSQMRSYQELMKRIFSHFDFGISKPEIDAIVDGAYAQWDNPAAVTPVKPLTGLGAGTSVHLLGLSEWPTYAFKDMALQVLARLVAKYANGKTISVVGASSGDTISAAHAAVRGISNIQSHFGLPAVGPSEVQRLQSTNSGSPNAYTILFNKAGFDPIQDAVKLLLEGTEFAKEREQYGFTAFNSINIARILAQIVYSFSGYFQMVQNGSVRFGDPVTYSVPSWNFGDALSVYYAKKMGLPVDKIVVATNTNDVLHRFLQTGVYAPPKKAQVTLAPSQDITTASNFERVLFDLLGAERTLACMDSLKQTGEFRVTPAELALFTEIFSSTTTTDAEIIETIQMVYARTSTLIDPHTATGVHGSIQSRSKLPVLAFETAAAVKFDQPTGVPQHPDRTRVTNQLQQNPYWAVYSSVTHVRDIALALLNSVRNHNA